MSLDEISTNWYVENINKLSKSGVAADLVNKIIKYPSELNSRKILT